jgi:hypothetical protein
MGARDVLGEDGRAVEHRCVVSAVAVMAKHGLRRLHVVEVRESTGSRVDSVIKSWKIRKCS